MEILPLSLLSTNSSDPRVFTALLPHSPFSNSRLVFRALLVHQTCCNTVMLIQFTRNMFTSVFHSDAAKGSNEIY